MKLDYKRTILIGFAFLSISAFWQMYDNIIPLILKYFFNIGDTLSGGIMALDNIFALFMLPIFGALSDKVSTNRGKRTPFIFVGTILAVIFMIFLPIAANMRNLALFIVMLLLTLIAMSTYRSPAVSLMPDVTPKPLRSKGNAIINLMGAVGGILYLIITAVMYPKSKTEGLEHVNYQPLFLIVGGIMLISVGLLLITINENKLVAENKELEAQHPEWNLAEEDSSGHEVLPKEVKKSLGFLLASIALWFIGYNGVTTWFTRYVAVVMGSGIGKASLYLTVATGGAIISYIPIGKLAQKLGRKKTIMAGTILLSLCFGTGYFLTTSSANVTVIMYVVFALVGLAWAAINVNSLNMVVEMCKGSDIGKFTGYYYTASMNSHESHRLPHTLPLCSMLRSSFLRHHVLRKARRRKGRSKERS